MANLAKLDSMNVQPIPEGYTSLTPFLVVDGAEAAIRFYIEVFGATLVEKMAGPNDTVAHAELDFGRGRLQLSDPNPGYHLEAPGRTESVTHSVVFYCTDVDDVLARAQRAARRSARRPRPSLPVTGSAQSSTPSGNAGRS